MNLPMSKALLSAGIAAALGLLSSTATAEAIDKRAAAEPTGEVEIVNVAGSVRITGWDRAEVEVRGELADRERLEFSTASGRTSIRVVAPGNRMGNGGTDLIVRVPERSALSVNTTSADQTIDRVKGRQRLQSVSGTIDTEIGADELYAKTISGDVMVLGVGTDATPAATMRRVTSVSGDLILSKISGEIDVETVSGDMQIDAGELTRARINTTNGDLLVSAKLAKEARFDAETINGDVRVKLLGTVDAEFDIHTFNGDIESCFGGETVRAREFGPGRDLDFTQGAGSARVRIKTLNGDVDLCGR